MKVVLVGVGNMGLAMVKAWLRTGIVDSSNLTLFDTDSAKLASAQKDLLGKDNFNSDAINDQIAKADLLVLAIKPQDLENAARQLAPVLSPACTIVSILAGISLAKLSNCFANNLKIVRSMPNIGARICQAITAFVATTAVEKNDADNAEKLLSALGPVEKLDSEELMDSWCAVAGSGPGFIAAIMESFIAAAVDQGFSAALAEKMVKQTFLGTVLLANESNMPVTDLKDSVTSKGGTTAAGLEAYASNKVPEIINKIVQAAAERGRQLNKIN